MTYTIQEDEPKIIFEIVSIEKNFVYVKVHGNFLPRSLEQIQENVRAFALLVEDKVYIVTKKVSIAEMELREKGATNI